MRRPHPELRALGTLALALTLAGCSPGTANMPAAMRQRVEAQGIVRHEDNARIRYTRGILRRQWDEGVASIVLTREGFLIHKHDRVLFEITKLNRGRYRVHRDHDRVAVASALPASRASWSWRPRDGDAGGWARDLRATLRGKGEAGDSAGAATGDTPGD